MNATLSTHVLDTARGIPAAGITIVLMRVDAAGNAEIVGSATTNADGRTDAPLAVDLAPGPYEIVFRVAPYFVDRRTFYDDIIVRIVLDGIRERYHVPLLLSPFGYSTYRGS
jgi:5-hydroxyisourate hydrolase